MVRGPGSNLFDAINRMQWTGSGFGFEPKRSGDWRRYEVKQAVIGVSYHVAAMRRDFSKVDASGKQARSIEVVAGPNAWDESTPGISKAALPVAVAQSRARDLWMTPHGFMSQVIKAGPQHITLGKRADKDTISVVVDGATLVAVLGDDKRPERIETQVKDAVLGATTLSYEYSAYQDLDHYQVQAPTRIVKKLGDRVVLDLTITEQRTGPYIVFPPPAALRQSGVQR
jgi:hypothetical protein